MKRAFTYVVKALTVIANPEGVKQSCSGFTKIAAVAAYSRSFAMTARAFTLAEVLITLAVIGIVAALTIPSVITNYQQQEFKTGLKKAVSVLNSAITTSIALDGESPYDNEDTYRYLQRHMNVVKSGRLPWISSYTSGGTMVSQGQNRAFYTADGMRFEFEDDGGGTHLKLHESDGHACVLNAYLEDTTNKFEYPCGGCGSLGLKENPNQTTKPPCALLVDVNGDRRPNPANVNAAYTLDSEGNVANAEEAFEAGAYKAASPDSKLVGDIFTILITEDRAIPYGIAAQRAMYGAK